jgi:hypothetical protein
MASNGPPPSRKPLSAHASYRAGRGSDYRGTSYCSSALSHTHMYVVLGCAAADSLARMFQDPVRTL